MRHSRIFVVVALLLASAGRVAAAPGPERGPDPRLVRLKTATFDPLAAPAQASAAADRVERYARGVRGAFLVQFDRPVGPSDLAALAEAGAGVKGYVPMLTLEVVMTEASRARVAALPAVRWIAPHQPEFKIYPGLGEVLDAGADADSIRLQVSLYPGEEQPALEAIRGVGARVLHVDRGRSFVVAYVDVQKVAARGLARIPTVRYLEQVYRPAPHNDRSRALTGLAAVADDTFSAGLDPSLDGRDEVSGFQVKYGHFDSGIQGAHADFDTVDLTFESGADSSDLSSGHGTHTAGSLVGDGGLSSGVPEVPPASGTVGPQRWRGVTPQAALHHISFENNYSDRQIFERKSEEGSQISSNSWGWVDFSGSSIRNYNTNAAVWDEGVWDADDDRTGLQPLTVFFSAGNNGGFNSPYTGCVSDGPDNVGSPGTAKNVITVASNETDRGFAGACGSFSALGDNVEEIHASSSRGPVDPDFNGRGLFKPDVTNVGGYWVMSVEALGTASSCSQQFILPDCPSDCSDTGPSYAYQNGTSMSTPLTAGLGGVLLQDLVVNRGVSQPKPSLIKALLVNGARDLTPSGCDYTFDVGSTIVHQGWGFVQAQPSLYGPGGSPGTRNIDFENEESANAVGTGESYSRQIEVSPGAPLKVSLVWTDYPASPVGGSPLVVNDLDLELSGPDGAFLGNNFSGNGSVAGGSADRYNVVENVFLENPVGGTYTITVRGFQVTQDQEPDKTGVNQDFSLVWSGALAPTTVCGDASCGAGEDVCSCPEDCGPPPPAEIACANGVDDDCDGAGDCADVDCAADAACVGFCGDGVCNAGEDCVVCDADCVSGGVACGNGICEAADGEDCETCAADCNGQLSGPPAERFCCGRDTPCSDGRCSASGLACSEDPTVPFCCGDGVCEGGESPGVCGVDCTLAAGSVPAVPGASSTPLTVSWAGVGQLTLAWDASCLATDDNYAVYQGSIGDFGEHVPVTCSTEGATTLDMPAPGESVYFLVVPRNAMREGSYGTDGDGVERAQGPSFCVEQEVATCVP